LAKQETLRKQELPTHVRVSIGSAIGIGLLEGKLDAFPSTAYLMTYKAGKCIANCGFCPQAKSSLSKSDLLSRVSWPAFSIQAVVKQIENAFRTGKIGRVCIQALNYQTVFDEIVVIVKSIKKQVDIPISVSCQPINKGNMEKLAQAGVNRIGIGIDAATKEIFDKIKGPKTNGPYRWQEQFKLLEETIDVFGSENISIHLIIGLGETEKQATQFIQKCVDSAVLPVLFAFTPIKGTKLSEKTQPPIASYRRIQLVRYLIVNKLIRFEEIKFNKTGNIIGLDIDNEKKYQIIETGIPFQTTGCPSCNRPFYNEKPSGPIYNYPRTLSKDEINLVKKQLGTLIKKQKIGKKKN